MNLNIHGGPQSSQARNLTPGSCRLSSSTAWLSPLSKNLPVVTLLPVDVRSEAEMAFEDLRQVALVGKSACLGKVSERHICLAEQPLGALDALAQHGLMETSPGRFSE